MKLQSTGSILAHVMLPGPESRNHEIWQTARKYPRVSITLPVEVHFGNLKTLMNTMNLSAGGMLLQPQAKPIPVGSEVGLRFNLPTGYSVSTSAKVVHLTTSAKVVHVRGAAAGLQFLGMKEESRVALSRFLRRMIVYVRRGVRVTRRMHVTIRPVGSPEHVSELAETIVISRHGALACTRGHFAVDDQIFVWWPDGRHGARARVVHRYATGTAGLMEVGFEFLQETNFWGLDFPEESQF